MWRGGWLNGMSGWLSVLVVLVHVLSAVRYISYKIIVSLSSKEQETF